MQKQTSNISVYRGTVPEFVHEPLDRLYRHLHSSSAYHTIYSDTSSDTHTFVARRRGEIIAVLLFRFEGNQVRVLNEQCSFEPDVIDAFSRYVFDNHAATQLVSFPVIENTPVVLSHPFQHAKCTQDIVLALPSSTEQYLANLGKSTRTYIKRYFNKLRRCFPSVSWTTCDGNEADEDQVRAIIAFNRARMAGKYKSSYIDEAEEDRIMRLVRKCGLVTVVTIDGQVCAGTINYRVADNYFLKVIAHDPAYDDYGLGTLCCYLTICECIARKGSEYHFLWGRYEYKYRLMGVQRDLSHLLIYRSRFHMLRNAGTAVRLACAGRMYEAKDWMEHRARRMDDSSRVGQAVFHCLNGLKKAKRMVDRLRMRQGAALEMPGASPGEPMAK